MTRKEDGVEETTSKPRHPSSRRFHELLQEEGELHDRKQLDYGSDSDPFLNVRQGAEEWGLRPWMGAMIRLTDKVKRLQSYAKKGYLANEGVADSLRDIGVYAKIALVLWEEEVVSGAADAYHRPRPPGPSYRGAGNRLLRREPPG